MTQPVRIAPDLFESARRVGETQERSAAQQLSHWARIGREIENSSAMSVAARGRLADAATYDQLAPAQQALVRAGWEDAMKERISSLDLRADLLAEGRRYLVVGDAAGAAHQLAATPTASARDTAATRKKTAAKKAAASRRTQVRRAKS